MAEKTILVCDVCGKPAAKSVLVVIDTRRVRKDYCATHLAELMKGSRPAGRGPGRPPGSRSKRAATAKSSRSRARTRARGPRKVSDDVGAEVAKLKGQGMSYRQVGQALMERGIKPPRAKAWNPVVLARLVKRHSA